MNRKNIALHADTVHPKIIWVVFTVVHHTKIIYSRAVKARIYQLFIITSPLKLIPHPPDGLDAVPFVAHFGAEFFYVGVDGAGVAEIVVVPDVV